MKLRFTLLAAVCVAASAERVHPQTPLGTSFRYQGQLPVTMPLEGVGDFQFRLFDAPTGGNQFGPTLSLDFVTIAGGRFTVLLDFGAGAFDENKRWLETSTRAPAGRGGSFITLSPRDELVAAAPYAVKVPGVDGHSLNADNDAIIDVVYVNRNGHVGIGTTNPLSKLHIDTVGPDNNGTDAPFRLKNFTQTLLMDGNEIDALADGLFLNNNSAGNVVLANGGGSVGIDTPTPQAKLDVNGSGHFSENVGIRTAPVPFAALNVSDGNAPGVNAALNVTGFTNHNGALQVQGFICATGDIGQCSDSRFKRNIEPLENALSLVQKLRPVRFDWKREAYPERRFTAERQVGFIAQEVLKIAPEIVHEDRQGYLAVDYGRLTPVLVEAVQELNGRLDDKDQQIASQRRTIADLSARLERMEAAVNALQRETR